MAYQIGQIIGGMVIIYLISFLFRISVFRKLYIPKKQIYSILLAYFLGGLLAGYGKADGGAAKFFESFYQYGAVTALLIAITFLYHVLIVNKSYEINWKNLIIHTALIWLVTYLSAFLVGFTLETVNASDTIHLELLLGISNLICVFFIILIITLFNKPSWLHIYLICILSTLSSLINVMFGVLPLQIIWGGIYMSLFILIAYTLGLLFLKIYNGLIGIKE